MNWTAIEPSPTADATRLTESARTSPTAKMPGTLVSRMCGGRVRGQPSSVVTRLPTQMKPFSSSFRQPSTQSVFGLRGGIAHALGLDREAVVVEHVEGAGAYGHNGADDAAFDAVLLAGAVILLGAGRVAAS